MKHYKYLDPFMDALVSWVNSTVWLLTLGRYCPGWEMDYLCWRAGYKKETKK